MIGHGKVRGTMRALAVVTVACVLSACGADEAVETEAAQEPGGGEAITIWTDRTELFFEHPAMIAGAEGEPWAVHLTDISDFQAVTEGRLTLRFEGMDGSVHTTIQEAPARAGVFDPAPSLPTAGMYDLIVILEGPQVEDEIFVGPIQVFASAADLPVLPEVESVGISFLKEQQWPIDFATAEARPRSVTAGVAVTGELRSAPAGTAVVTAPVSGIVRWDLNRTAPAEGEWVQAGSPLIRMAPVSEEGGYAELRARAARLTREVERTERLVSVEAVPARRLEEARRDLQVVAAQLTAMGATGDEDGYLLTLPAPISGAIAERLFEPGARVEAGAPLLRIVDPRVLHLVLHTPAVEAGAAADARAATFTPEGMDTVLRTDRLVSVGAVLDPVRRTVPVTFEVANADRALRAGTLVTARILGAEPESALAVPAEAILDEDGLLVAYVQISGESFERRAVTVGATDGQWTVILSGVRRGERVVTRGQYQIKLSSLNTSEISDHGHPH